MTPLRPGPTNSLVDVAGLRVGHAQRAADGWLTGTTVVLAPAEGAVAGVDVRGGGPGTRETDLLDPRNLVQRVQAVVLGGGSAFGLAAADGVMTRLAADGRGFPLPGGLVVPIVPAAVVFDLGRGDGRARWPDASFGESAYDDAAGAGGDGPVRQGVAGAGTGAVVGGLKGGVGSASVQLPDGGTVAALAVVNAVGSAVHPATGELLAARLALAGEVPWLVRPDASEAAAARAALDPGGAAPLATTIGVLATDAALTKAQCQKLAGMGHDGMARAIDPVHTMFDGDTVFGLATGARAAPDLLGYQALLVAAAQCFSRAVLHAVLSATSVRTSAGTWRSYRELFPSAVVAGVSAADDDGPPAPP